MCFGCLTIGHHSKPCRSRHVCAVCSNSHPILLHDYTHKDNVTPAPAIAESVTSSPTSSGTVCLCDHKLSGVKTSNQATNVVLPVVIRHPSCDTQMTVYALLDTQSNTNFVTNEVVDFPSLSGCNTTRNLTTMNGRMKSPTVAVDGLQVRGVLGGSYIGIATCYTKDSIPCNRDNIPTADLLDRWSHLAHIDLPQYYDDAPIGLLIGYHCPQVMRPLEIVIGSDDEPFGWKTNVGWWIVGTGDTGESGDIGTSHFVQGCIAFKAECREVMVDADDNKMTMHEMYDKYSVEDVQFMRIMSEKMFQRDDRHYEALLPMKGDSVFLKNKHVAQRRLNSLKNRFERDEFHERYSEVMREMLESEFAKLFPPQGSVPYGRTWYIPHHGVQQTNNLSVAFDCSSECRDMSLNQRLLQGLNMMNLLMEILFRFRLEPVALTCDITKMYYQFKVSLDDRDLLQFLWWKDDDFQSDPVAFRMCVHLFGATSSPGFATYALRKIAVDHGSKCSPWSFPVCSQRFLCRWWCNFCVFSKLGVCLDCRNTEVIGWRWLQVS